MHVQARDYSAQTSRSIGTGFAHPETRGYHVMFRSGTQNVCPGCGGSSWHVGRVTAECGHCLTALPIQQQQGCEGVGLFSSRGHDGSADAVEFAVA